MKKLLMSLVVTGYCSLVTVHCSYATPSTQIWIPSTDIQKYKTLHLNIDSYLSAGKESGGGRHNGGGSKWIGG